MSDDIPDRAKVLVPNRHPRGTLRAEVVRRDTGTKGDLQAGTIGDPLTCTWDHKQPGRDAGSVCGQDPRGESRGLAGTGMD
jgi:hypothetical protein